jgi:hypothetical protein
MAVTRRTRRTKGGSSQVVDLKAMVDSLIRENAKLKRQIARLEEKTVGKAATSVTRGLASIARKVERALAPSSSASRRSRRTATTTSGRRSRSATAAKPSTPRKPASPEV